MIRYSLRCDKGHDFDGWFRSAADFDRQNDSGLVSCTICGSVVITKALMAPAVAAKRTDPGPDPKPHPLEQLRREVEANSDYVGMRFAAEARAMHEGQSESRAIHGEAKLEDARKLLEDGIPVAPLPFRPRQKTN